METFLYIKLGSGKVTVAINEKDNLVQIGAAFCSPSDQFIKERGRQLALDRLNNKKCFYVCFKRDKSNKLKWQVNTIVKFIVAGKWVTKLDIENELGIIIYGVVIETIHDLFSDIAPTTMHTNTIPIWAKHATNEKNFY